MSLRTSYSGALDSKLAEARTSGRDFIIVTNLASITSSMAASAAKGTTKFTVTLSVSYQPADLRLLGPLWYAYQSGVLEGLAQQDIMGNEVVVALNVSDNISTSIDLKFSF